MANTGNPKEAPTMLITKILASIFSGTAIVLLVSFGAFAIAAGFNENAMALFDSAATSVFNSVGNVGIAAWNTLPDRFQIVIGTFFAFAASVVAAFSMFATLFFPSCWCDVVIDRRKNRRGSE